METLHAMHNSLETTIEREDSVDLHISTDKSQLEKHTFRGKLGIIIHSTLFGIGIIVLVITDCVLVIAELLLDVLEGKTGMNYALLGEILSFASLLILGIFIVEIAARLYVMRLTFFKHAMEIFDATIVIISFIVDIVFHNSEGSLGVGLLIILRLWRLTRIVNGVIVSAKRQAANEIEKERKYLKVCNQEVAKLQEICNQQQAELKRLQMLLRQFKTDLLNKELSLPVNVIIERLYANVVTGTNV